MRPRLLRFLVVLLALFHSLFAAAQGTAFTYQGFLSAGASPANGRYDLRFLLYNAVTNGVSIAGPATNLSVVVTNGVFITAIDFGEVFTGSNCWLDIAVRTNGGGTFTELAPRQPILALPYAVMANSANNLLGTLPATQLSGTIPLSQLPGTVLTNGATSVNLSGTFAGNAFGITNLSGNNFLSQGPNTIFGNGTGGSAKPGGSTNGAYLANTITAQNLNVVHSLSFPSNVVNQTNVFLQLGNNNFLYFSQDLTASILAKDHSGGLEMGITSPRIAIIPGNGDVGALGAVQFGRTGVGQLDGSHALYYWNQSKYAQDSSDPLGYGYLLEFFSGSYASASPVAFRSEAVDTNGTGQFSFYGGLTYNALSSADAGPDLNEAVGSSIVQMRAGTNANSTGVVLHGSLTKDVISITPGTTNYDVNWDATNLILNISQNLNLTNIADTPFLRTNQSDTIVIKIFPGLGSFMLTVPANWNTNASFTRNIAASNEMKLTVTRDISNGMTNYDCDQQIYFYTPSTDPLAGAFLATTGITAPLYKNQLNNLCLGLTANGLSGTNKLVEGWPMIGDTGSGATNNVGLRGHNLVQHGAITNTANGMAFDGATGYADTGLIPTNCFASLNSACLVAYFRNPGNGLNPSTFSAIIAASDSSALVDCGLSAYNAGGSGGISAQGLNAFSPGVDGMTLGNIEDFMAVNRTKADTQLICGGGTVQRFADVSATGLGMNYSFYIGARNFQGTADHFMNGQLAGVFIFQNMTASDLANLQSLLVQFNSFRP